MNKQGQRRLRRRSAVRPGLGGAKGGAIPGTRAIVIETEGPVISAVFIGRTIAAAGLPPRSHPTEGSQPDLFECDARRRGSPSSSPPTVRSTVLAAGGFDPRICQVHVSEWDAQRPDRRCRDQRGVVEDDQPEGNRPGPATTFDRCVWSGGAVSSGPRTPVARRHGKFAVFIRDPPQCRP